MQRTQDYIDTAKKIFSPIPQYWDPANYTPDFWHTGNAFTTLIDYYVQLDPKNPSLSTLPQQTLASFDQHYNEKDPDNPAYGRWWFDDFGWWGVAFLRAADEAATIGLDSGVCLNRAITCWNMNKEGTGVWDRADHTTYRLYGPRFPGGCWNRDYAAPWGDPRPEVNPPFSVNGRQNTVTNGQYLVLSLRCALADPQVPDFRAAAKTMWNWFQSWNGTDVSADQQLLAILDGSVMYRERASSYAFVDGRYPPDTSYDPQHYWAGDQGILLGALVDLARLDPPNAPSYRSQARALLQGVLATLQDAQNNLLPWHPASFNPDPGDYTTGPGVFLRYLNYAVQQDAQIMQFVQQQPGYQALLQANAEAAVKNPAILPGGDWNVAINQLAALLAAITILAPTPSPQKLLTPAIGCLRGILLYSVNA
jgi:hypothetical protein